MGEETKEDIRQRIKRALFVPRTVTAAAILERPLWLICGPVETQPNLTARSTSYNDGQPT